MEKISIWKTILSIFQSYGSVIAAFATIISAIAAFSSANIANKLYSLKTPAYAIVNKNGDILEKQNFGKFGLLIKKDNRQGTDNNRLPVYRLIFSKAPDYFEISTQANAIREIKQITTQEYEIIFIQVARYIDDIGQVIECDFKVQAYDYK